MHKRTAHKKIAGFTLIEIAVVVLIVAMTLTMGLSALNAYLAKESVTLTQLRQQAIKDALLGLLMRSKRLPCPDANFDGVEDTSDWTAGTKQCLNLWGPIPYVTLGLSKETALDGWANPFDYYVSPNWAFDTTGNPFNLNTNTNAPGLIPVYTRTIPTATPIKIADPAASPPAGAVVVIVSHGPNGAGAFSTQQGARVAAINAADVDEAANAPGALTAAVPILVGNVIRGGPSLVIRDTNVNTDNTANVGGVFDDVVQIIRREDFTVTMTKSGLTQPIESQVAAAFQQAQLELIGFVRANTTANASCTVTPPSASCLPANIYYLPSTTTCSPTPCTFPATSAVDPCNPSTTIGYFVVYDIKNFGAPNTNNCGGPPLTTTKAALASTLLDQSASIPPTSPTIFPTASSPNNTVTPYLAVSNVISPCAGNASVGGGGVVFVSSCNGTTFSTPLPKAYLQGIQ